MSRQVIQTSLPAPKYLKGFATAQAVELNGQLTLDFGLEPDRETGTEVTVPDMATWFLLFRMQNDTIIAELSLPDAIEKGRITNWLERIILPSFPRPDGGPFGDRQSGPDDGPDDIIVEVSRRK